VRQYWRPYGTDGTTGLAWRRYQGSDPAQLVILMAELEAGLHATAKAVRACVQRRFAVRYTAIAMGRLLKRLGFAYEKPKGVRAKHALRRRGAITRCGGALLTRRWRR
jgi:transposase